MKILKNIGIRFLSLTVALSMLIVTAPTFTFADDNEAQEITTVTEETSVQKGQTSIEAEETSAQKDQPTIDVDEPQEDIAGKIVSSANSYLNITTDDELEKAPAVLEAAQSDESTIIDEASEQDTDSNSKNDSDDDKNEGSDRDDSDGDSSGSEDSSSSSDSDMLVEMTEDEIYMFASEVYCEAGAESYETQVGVAQVIINRILSSRFPDTLEGVLYQSGQFPPATSGFMDRVMASGEGNNCRAAVMDALHGADVVGDYLYFNMTSGVDFSSVTSSMTLDQTTFYSVNE